MNKRPPKPGHNVVRIPTKPRAGYKAPPRHAAGELGALAVAGSPDDPRMQEALRLAQAFLAIEDAQARSALVALAESLVNYRWALAVRER
ncbi:MAG: hypothetical protein K9G60_12400 [Pseudolabrys sp.]|nr:hypothetical protein [Pseudolabrys sp.]